MTLTEITRAMRKLRVSGIRLRLRSRSGRAAASPGPAPGTPRETRQLPGPGQDLDTFDFDFNRKLDRRLVFELAAGHSIASHEDALILGPPGTWNGHRPVLARPEIAEFQMSAEDIGELSELADEAGRRLHVDAVHP